MIIEQVKNFFTSTGKRTKSTLFRWRRVKDHLFGKPYSKEKKIPKNPKAVTALEKLYQGRRVKAYMSKVTPKRHESESMEDFKERRKLSNQRRREREKLSHCCQAEVVFNNATGDHCCSKCRNPI